MQVPTHVAKHVGFVVVLPQSNKALRLYILFLEIYVHTCLVVNPQNVPGTIGFKGLWNGKTNPFSWAPHGLTQLQC